MLVLIVKNIMTKRFFVSIMVLAVAATVVGVAAQAADTADVSATVTAELITISVDNGSVAYGVLPVDTNADTVDLSQTQVVSNDGNVNVDLEVRSSDAVGGNDWNLAASNASLDEFTHEFSSNDGTSWASFNVVNATYTSLASNIAATVGTQNLDLRIKTPTSVTDNTLKTITVTVLATAI